MGIIRDIGLTGGFDFNAKDDQFSSRVYKWALGPKVSFDVPGFFDVAVVWRTEHNHNWYATGPGFGTRTAHQSIRCIAILMSISGTPPRSSRMADSVPRGPSR